MSSPPRSLAPFQLPPNASHLSIMAPLQPPSSSPAHLQPLPTSTSTYLPHLGQYDARYVSRASSSLPTTTSGSMNELQNSRRGMGMQEPSWQVPNGNAGLASAGINADVFNASTPIASHAYHAPSYAPPVQHAQPSSSSLRLPSAYHLDSHLPTLSSVSLPPLQQTHYDNYRLQTDPGAAQSSFDAFFDSFRSAPTPVSSAQSAHPQNDMVAEQVVTDPFPPLHEQKPPPISKWPAHPTRTKAQPRLTALSSMDSVCTDAESVQAGRGNEEEFVHRRDFAEEFFVQINLLRRSIGQPEFLWDDMFYELASLHNFKMCESSTNKGCVQGNEQISWRTTKFQTVAGNSPVLNILRDMTNSTAFCDMVNDPKSKYCAVAFYGKQDQAFTTIMYSVNKPYENMSKGNSKEFSLSEAVRAQHFPALH